MNKLVCLRRVKSITIAVLAVLVAGACSPGFEGGVYEQPPNVALTFINESSIEVRVFVSVDGIDPKYVIISPGTDFTNSNKNKVFIFDTDIVRKIVIYDNAVYNSEDGAENTPLLEMKDTHKDFSASFSPEFTNAERHLDGEYFFTITDTMLGR